MPQCQSSTSEMFTRGRVRKIGNGVADAPYNYLSSARRRDPSNASRKFCEFRVA